MFRSTRREFIHRTSYAAGALWLGSRNLAARLAELPPLAQKFAAADTVTLGSTGIQTSRLAMGTGTVGSGHHSNQTALGVDGLSRLLLNGYHSGLRFFDAADSYGSHPHVAQALKQTDRSKVTLLTKSLARDAAGMRADLERFRRELNSDHLDIVLMHCVTEPDWTTQFRGAMDVLSEAKQKGMIRAHGCSCHSIEALRAAAKSPWVDVDLARINPVGAHMDADPGTVVGVLREMKAAGKAVVGMKILGQGAMRNRQDEAIRFALGLGVLDAFTIGAESIDEQKDLVRRISAAA
jgi:aryl-alcohol dehydrogenase-like predicted oxidoreductase